MRPSVRTLASAIVLALLAPAAHAAVTDEFVVGGEQVADNDVWPWQVRIFESEDPDSGFCGGSLIAPDWVLTAAHCALDRDGEVMPHVLVGYGSVYQSKLTLIDSAKIIPHPDYPERDTDLALIKLAEPVPNARWIEIASPEVATAVTEPGANLMITGWGAVWDFQGFSEALSMDRDVVSPGQLLSTEELLSPDQMRQAEIELISAEECRKAYEAFGAAAGDRGLTISRSEMCAGSPEGSRGSCFGDSGGPLLAAADNDEGYVQVGIVSWGVQCGNPSLPGVYARVSYFYKWIHDVMASK